MELVIQETAKGCGPACVAMICGISFQEALLLVGHKGGTRPKHLAAALATQGWKLDSKFTRGFPPGGTSICRVCWYPEGSRVGQGHWVLVHEGQVLDPWYGPNPNWPHGGRITSFARVVRA